MSTPCAVCWLLVVWKSQRGPTKDNKAALKSRKAAAKSTATLPVAGADRANPNGGPMARVTGQAALMVPRRSDHVSRIRCKPPLAFRQREQGGDRVGRKIPSVAALALQGAPIPGRQIVLAPAWRRAAARAVDRLRGS